MLPRVHRWKENGLELEHNVLEWGAPDRASGPTALLVHGFQDAAATWDDVAAPLAASGLRVLVPDMRGFGDGPRVPAGGYYYFPDYVADLFALLRHIGDSPLFLVGHSMGAGIVSYFAGAFPERVTKLALVDGVGPMDNPPTVAPTRMRRWIETTRQTPPGDRKPMTRADALGRLVRFNPHVEEATLARRVGQLARETGETNEQGETLVTWKYDPLHVTTSPVPFYAESYKSFCRLVTCPVLHVSGGVRGFHVDDEEERLACFANLTRVTIDGGHALHWTKPAELTEALVGFWRG